MVSSMCLWSLIPKFSRQGPFGKQRDDGSRYARCTPASRSVGIEELRPSGEVLVFERHGKHYTLGGHGVHEKPVFRQGKILTPPNARELTTSCP